MDPLVAAIANSFQPFVSNAACTSRRTTTTPRRKVEYGTGLVVSTAGHIVTDLQVVDACQVVADSADWVMPNGSPWTETTISRCCASTAPTISFRSRCLAMRRRARISPSWASPIRKSQGRQCGNLDEQRAAGQYDLDQRHDDHAQSDSGAGLFRRGRARQERAVLRHGGTESDGGCGHRAGGSEGDHRACRDNPQFHRSQLCRARSGQIGVDNAKASVVRVICVRK